MSMFKTNKMFCEQRKRKRGERGLINISNSSISLCRLNIILENVTYTEKCPLANENFSEF